MGEGKGTCRPRYPSCSLGFQTKATNQHARDLQVQGTLEHPWRGAEAWSQLLGDLIPSGQLVLNSPLSCFGPTRRIDFVQAFPHQADVECDLFMHLPRGLTFAGVHRSTHCLKMKKNLYGSRQAGRVWNQHLVNGLVRTLKFKQSAIDECVFYRGTTVLLIYVDDGILSGPSADEIQTIIKELGELFNITDEGEIDAYLGVKISRPKRE
jgi:hypothetical protein